MTIEIAILISGVSLAFGIYSGISNLKRNSRIDVKNEAAQLTTVIVKLENINSLCSEIKSDLSTVKSDVKDITERVVKVEESVKSAHKRIDEFFERK